MESVMHFAQSTVTHLGLPVLSPAGFVSVFLAIMAASKFWIQPLKIKLETKWGEQEGLAATLALVQMIILYPIMWKLFETSLDEATLLALLAGGIGAQYAGNVIVNKVKGTTDTQEKVKAGVAMKTDTATTTNNP